MLYNLVNQKNSNFSHTFLKPVVNLHIFTHEQAAVWCFRVDGIDGIFL